MTSRVKIPSAWLYLRKSSLTSETVALSSQQLKQKQLYMKSWTPHQMKQIMKLKIQSCHDLRRNRVGIKESGLEFNTLSHHRLVTHNHRLKSWMGWKQSLKARLMVLRSSKELLKARGATLTVITYRHILRVKQAYQKWLMEHSHLRVPWTEAKMLNRPWRNSKTNN